METPPMWHDVCFFCLKNECCSIQFSYQSLLFISFFFCFWAWSFSFAVSNAGRGGPHLPSILSSRSHTWLHVEEESRKMPRSCIFTGDLLLCVIALDELCNPWRHPPQRRRPSLKNIHTWHLTPPPPPPHPTHHTALPYFFFPANSVNGCSLFQS